MITLLLTIDKFNDLVDEFGEDSFVLEDIEIVDGKPMFKVHVEKIHFNFLADIAKDEEAICNPFEDADDMLGLIYKDVVSGFQGTVVMVGVDLDNVVSALVQPAAKNGTLPKGEWIAINRLKEV